MSLRIVRLGSPRHPKEGLRIGTVRRPPRGVPKAEFGTRNYYDTWLPILSPSDALMKQGQAVETDADWKAFARAFKAELARPEAQHTLALLAALSKTTDLSVGCYCEDEARCHRSVLRAMLTEAGAEMAP
ncbi:MAG: DUF488 family protein [Acidobacteria bacterium]|nr:DUF488 family protein [Acidobacteriota bacterium]